MRNLLLFTFTVLSVICMRQEWTVDDEELRNLRLQVDEQRTALDYNDDVITELQQIIAACRNENNSLRFQAAVLSNNK